jgi:outer membrane protein TolC
MNMKKIILTLALAGMAFLPSLALAETKIISEAQILQAAMQASPDFQAAVRDGTIEKADAGQAGRLDNPTVELNALRTSTAGSDENSFDLEIEQPFKLSQLTGQRARLSNALFEQAELRQQHAMLEAFWRTKMLYAQVWQYQEQAKLYADFQKRAAGVAAQVGKAVKDGQTPVSEGSLFTGDAAKLASDLENIKAQEGDLRLQLSKVTGLDLADAVLEKPILPPLNADIAYLEGKARENASLVRLLESDLQAAQRQKQAALADSGAPEIAPRFIYGRNSDANEDTAGLGVVLTIPLWDQNQLERQKADAAQLYTQRQLDTLQRLPLSERLQRIVNTIDRLDRRVRILENEALPNYRKGFTQVQKSYRAGQADAVALWQIRERLFETEQEALKATLETVAAHRILSLETGILPQEVTP